MKNPIQLVLLCLYFISGNAQEKLNPSVQKKDPLKEVLLIGTFHYNNPGADVAKTKSFDILNQNSQQELKHISTKIAEYKPNKIFVE